MVRIGAALFACLASHLIASSGSAGDDDGTAIDDAAASDAGDANRADSSPILDSSVNVDATRDGAVDVDAGPCESDMALIDVPLDGSIARVCIDRYEGAIVHRLADGGDGPWPHYTPLDGEDAGDFRAIPARGIVPQGYISQEQAAAACEASNKRLCTFDEWTAACRGRPAHDYVYPYGDTYEPGACNEGKESPITTLFGPSPTYSNAELNDPRCDQIDGGVAAGGDYSKCVSAYGAFDMHGNLHEWIDDTPDLSEPTHGSFMGGYFVDATINGAGCTYRTTAHAKTYHDYSTGFRCCADARG